MPTTSCSQDNLNQFVRSKFDLHSAIARLASRGEGFASSVEFANVISRGIHVEFADALWETLGNCSDALGSDDLCPIVDLYNAALGACNNADAAAEIPAL